MDHVIGTQNSNFLVNTLQHDVRCLGMKSYYFPSSVQIFRLDTPETTTLEFESTFVVDEETQKEFKKISERRQSALAASSKNYVAGAIVAISEYLPLVLGLMNAAEKLPADFSRYLRISWNSSLTSGFYKTTYYSHYNWHFEVTHILLVCLLFILFQPFLTFSYMGS